MTGNGKDEKPKAVIPEEVLELIRDKEKNPEIWSSKGSQGREAQIKKPEDLAIKDPGKRIN